MTELDNKINQYLNTYRANFPLSGNLLLAKEGKIFHHSSWGKAERSFDIENTIDTRFPIASLTKAFTAAAILILVDQGKLSLDDDAGKFLPRNLKFKNKIPIHQLLSHSAGLPDYQLGKGEILEVVFARRMGSDEFCQRFLKHPLVAKSGEKFHYSNPGYYFLGMIIESVSEVPFGKFLEKNIFEKAGMDQTGVDNPEVIIPLRAQGYRWNQDTICKAAYTDARNFYPQGGLYSTTGDLLKWINALKSGKIISKNLLDQMLSRQIVLNAEKDINYGFGIHILTRHGKEAVGHGGSHWGYRSHLEWYPKEDILAVMLSNFGFQDTAKIADALIHQVFNLPFPKPEKPPRVEILHDILKKYDGNYQNGNFVLKLSVEEEQIRLQIDGEDIEVYPIGEGHFAHAYLDETYQVKVDDKGEMSLWGCKKVK